MRKPEKDGAARSISLRVRITPKLLRELKRLADDNRRTVSNYGSLVSATCSSSTTQTGRRTSADSHFRFDTVAKSLCGSMRVFKPF